MKAKITNINPQDTFAVSLEGIYLVDAGAGTGKTHTIIRRYENLINKGVDPKEILLITFTRNAAEKMRNDVITKKFEKDIFITDLLEAPIMNFHSFCMRFLKKNGLNAPGLLGIDEILAGNFDVAEDDNYENELFRKFYLRFRKKTFRKFENIYKSLGNDQDAVLSIIKKLCSIGIFPSEKGWFGDGEKFLYGNKEKYSEIFDELNKKNEGKNGGENLNELNKIIKGMKDLLIKDFDAENELEGKRVKADLKDRVFNDENQKELIGFVREVYHSYIGFMVNRNILNFDFVIMFAYLILYNDDKIRENSQYEYIMVDEFQDTDEIQFLLLMLLCKSENNAANLSVVGDWKQGIYGFRNTTIENITLFAKRLSEYKKLLNIDNERIKFSTDSKLVNKITFEYNYRSSQKILDFSMHTLFCNGSKNEENDFESLRENFNTALIARRNLEDISEIEFYNSDENDSDSEIELILKKISELTNEKRYFLREFDNNGNVNNERSIRYSDIAILARNNEFGLRLQNAALKKNIPVNFDGGLELFTSEQGILLLGWLRVMLNVYSIEGWLPILEKDGNNYKDLNYLTDLISNNSTNVESDYFKELFDFREKLVSENENLLNIIEKIFSRYGFEDEYCNAIITEFTTWTKGDLLTPADLAGLINKIKNKTFKVEISNTDNAVIFQTIHGAKGLEYPVVILGNMNPSVFPSSRSTTNNIFYDPVSGLRSRKQFDRMGDYSAVFDNWKTEILLRMMKSGNYDEERRLLYVAVTRAKQYLYFTSRKRSQFFNDLLSLSEMESNAGFDYEIIPVKFESKIDSEKISLKGLKHEGKKFVSVHTLMEKDESIIGEQETVQDLYSTLKVRQEAAMEYGNKIHLAAHKLAGKKNNDNANFQNEEIKKIAEFLNACDADEILSEVDFLYPKGNKIIRGTIDLLLIYEDSVEIIDYKTDKSRKYLGKYKKQLEIYKEFIEKIYPGKNVAAKIFFTGLNEIIVL